MGRPIKPSNLIRASRVFYELDKEAISDAVVVLTRKLGLLTSVSRFNDYPEITLGRKMDLTYDIERLLTAYLLDHLKRNYLNLALKKDSRRNLFNNRQTY